MTCMRCNFLHERECWKSNMEYERKETGSLKNKIQKEFYSLLISNLELNQVKRERERERERNYYRSL